MARKARTQPENPDVWLGLSQVALRESDSAGAADAARRAGETGGAEAYVQQALSMHYAQVRDWTNAGEWAMRYARSRPTDVGALATAIQLLQRAGMHAEVSQLWRGSPLRGQDAAVENAAGKSLLAAGSRDDSLQALARAVELAPYDEGYRWDQGYAQLSTGAFGDAIQGFQDARKVFDKSARLALGLGIAYYGRSQFREAIGAFLSASRLAPGMPQAHAFLGEALAHAAERLGEIRERFEAFAEANPESALGPYLLARVALAQAGPAPGGDLDAQARNLLETSLERDPLFVDALIELGVLLTRIGDYSAACEALERARELSPKEPRVYFQLGRVYARLGRDEESRAAQAKHQALLREARSGMGLSAGLSSDPDAAP